MRIWIVTVGEPSPVDGVAVRLHRAGLLSRYMHQRGHEVVSFNGTIEHSARRQRFEETTVTKGDDGMAQVFLHGRIYQRNISPARIGNNRDVGKSFTAVSAKLEKPDVIVCSYPPIELAYAVSKYAKANNIPYVLDLRDMWPDIIADVAPKLLRPLARLAMFRWFSQARTASRLATGLVGISRPFLDWGLGMAKRKAGVNDRVFHLANDPDAAAPDELAKAEAFWDAAGVTPDKFILLFSGMYSARHDFETVINGAHLLPDDLKANIRIVFCGKGEAEEKMKAAANSAPYIVFAGWRNLADIQTLCKRAKGGLLPYPSTQDFMISYPNKVGEYLSAGLPIITSLKGEITKLIGDENCGVLYTEGDAKSFANAVMQLIRTPDSLKVMSNAAFGVYARAFNPKQIYADYAAYIEGFRKS